MVWWKWTKMLTFETVCFSSSFFPRYRQGLTKTLRQVSAVIVFPFGPDWLYYLFMTPFLTFKALEENNKLVKFLNKYSAADRCHLHDDHCPSFSLPWLEVRSSYQSSSNKNDRRNSGCTLRQKFNLIDIWHLIFDIWHFIFDIWHLTFFIQPKDQRSYGPMDQWTNGQMD